MKKFKKLDYYTDMVRTSEKDRQEENFILGLVKFFNNFNTFYHLIQLIEEEFNTVCYILPSFNSKSEDDTVSNFRLLRLKINKKVLDQLNEKFIKLEYKNKEVNFQFFLEEETNNSETIQIVLQ